MYDGRGMPAERWAAQELAEVKVLYNMMYPLDSMDATDHRFGADGTGLSGSCTSAGACRQGGGWRRSWPR